MKNLSQNPIPFLLGLLGLIAATESAFGRTGFDTTGSGSGSTDGSRAEGIRGGRPGPSTSLELSEESRAAQALMHAEEKARNIQIKFQLQTSKEAEPVLTALENELAKAREAMAARNFPVVLAICAQTETQIALLYNLGSRTFRDRSEPAVTNTDSDPKRILEQNRARAEWDMQRAMEHINLTTQFLQESKSPEAIALIEKCRSILDAVKLAISQEHFEQVRPLLEQIESLRLEISQLTPHSGRFDNHGVPGTNSDGYKSPQAKNNLDLASAMEIYNRVHDRVVRLTDQTQSKEDEKSAALFNQIVDMVEKCREALNNGQVEAAKVLGLKAEAMLTEWHRGHEGSSSPVGQGGLSNHSQNETASALDRLKLKFERAGQIVAQAKNEKASNILEKGLEHLERAQTSQGEGQAARAKVEMDIALKLAAKAVDIARSSQKR